MFRPGGMRSITFLDRFVPIADLHGRRFCLPLLDRVFPAPYRVFPALFRVLPVQVSIVVGRPPAVAAVSARAGLLWIVVGIAVEWRSPGVAVLPGILAGPRGATVLTAFGVSTPGHPKFAVSPNACSFSSCSSSVPPAGGGSAGSSMDVLPNDAPCSYPSSFPVSLNKRMGPSGSSPTRSHSAVTDTSALPTDATTNHHRKRCPHPCRGRHRHTSRGSPPSLEVQKIR